MTRPRFIPIDEWIPRGIPSLEPTASDVARSTTNTLVLAGPGAGKTELLAQRASFLLEAGICRSPRRILAISFKKDAARNLHERVARRTGAFAQRMDSMTFDAFAKGIVDQFRPALPLSLRPSPDYEIILKEPKAAEIEDTLLALGEPPRSLGVRDDLRGLAGEDFFRKVLPCAPLGCQPKSLEEWAAQGVWARLLSGTSHLSFPMLTRLAAELLRDDARLRRAYRSSYSHVFLDEFQDTTKVQYLLTAVLFRETPAVLTAVGDSNQRIMGWAGAMDGIFDAFLRDFNAERKQLLANHRASADLLPVVRHVAARLHGGVSAPAVATASVACVAYTFTDEDAEANWVAKEIAQLLERGTDPRQVAVLVRMKVSTYAQCIIDALSELGHSARVEDQLQELLSEPVCQLAILGLRALGASRPRSSWAAFRDAVAVLRGIERDDEESIQRLDRELESTRRELRSAHREPPSEVEAAESIFEEFLLPFLAKLRSRHPQYRKGTFFADRVLRLCEALAGNTPGSWNDVLDRIEGVGCVPILTIHKSKGLEYEAVFFVGLEDQAFWNFGKNPKEETNAFFVALSRAKSRVIFTFSGSRNHGGRTRRQSTENIRKLYDLIREIGVNLQVAPQP